MSSNPQPQEPSPFGAKPAEASTATDSAPSSGSGGFGTVPSLFSSTNTAQNNTTNSPAAPKTPLFGSGILGSTRSSDAPATATPKPPAPLFGGPVKTTTAQTAGPSASTPLFGNAPTTTQTVTSVPAPSTLRGKTVEDIVNRWATELETHTREFSQFAREVAVWDRTLVDNGNYISGLYATVLGAESTQASLDQSLDHIEQQQRHLTAALDQYEKSASEILHGPGGIMTSTEGLGLADSERDKSYALAANLYTQLDDLTHSLTQMVETVNGLDLSPRSSQNLQDESHYDAISTIAGILNTHLSSLQWIDDALTEMESKVKDAERKIKDNTTRGSGRTGMNKGRSYGIGSAKW